MPCARARIHACLITSLVVSETVVSGTAAVYVLCRAPHSLCLHPIACACLQEADAIHAEMQDTKRAKRQTTKVADETAQKPQSTGSLYLAMQQDKYKPR